MLRHISISAFINIIFTTAFVAIIVTFALFINLDRQKYEILQQNRYELIAEAFLKTLNARPTKDDLKLLFSQFKVELVEDRDLKLDIINQAQEMTIKKTIYGIYRVYQHQNEYYIYVQFLGYNLMLKDVNSNRYNITIIILLLILSLSTIFFLYFILKRKLKPLRELNGEIRKFSQGDLNLNIKPKSNDEIGEIAKSFDVAINQINNQVKSKNLFMRNMMHELKTPITKAMFIAETLDDDKARLTLQKAFSRMDDIIKELATVEKITSNTSITYKEVTKFFNVYQRTLEIMMIESSQLNTKIKDFTFEVDTSLFSVALKNLIDNGIKFSPNSKAILEANKNEIRIISQGQKLKYDLDYYTEPFCQEEKRADGFGLGLYIVKTILQMHNFKLKYKYQYGHNHFIIKLQPDS